MSRKRTVNRLLAAGGVVEVVAAGGGVVGDGVGDDGVGTQARAGMRKTRARPSMALRIEMRWVGLMDSVPFTAT
jgi:hypothetical protein